MQRSTNNLVCFAAFLFLLGATNLLAQDETVPLPKIAPPSGFQWVLNEEYSDEFNGTQLNDNKWHDHYPGWEGRVPGKFVPEAISVKDGHLRIRSHVLEPPQGEQGQWTIGCGAVQSKGQQAHYGYYECRMKASSVSTSSTFWLKNPRPSNKERPYVSTELDITECIGNAQRWPGFAEQMHSNTHIVLYPEIDPSAKDGSETDQAKTTEQLQEEAEKNMRKKNARVSLGGRVDDAFHTYGCWWVDANRMEFYLDGKHVYTIEPETDLVEKPFSQPMFVNLVCEIYTWEVLPKLENLRDDSKNTTYYDYVRAYKLEPVK